MLKMYILLRLRAQAFADFFMELYFPHGNRRAHMEWQRSNFTIRVSLHASRASYDAKLKKSSPEWEVGNTSNDGEIDMLHVDAFERYSSHVKDEFWPIFDHEASHVLLRELAGDRYIPRWLNEGLAMHIASQSAKYHSVQGLCIEDDFTSKLSSDRGWNMRAGHDAYAVACLFVDYLVETYGFANLIKLVRVLEKNYYGPNFKAIFKETFGTDIGAVESNFVRTLNSR